MKWNLSNASQTLALIAIAERSYFNHHATQAIRCLLVLEPPYAMTDELKSGQSWVQLNMLKWSRVASGFAGSDFVIPATRERSDNDGVFVGVTHSNTFARIARVMSFTNEESTRVSHGGPVGSSPFCLLLNQLCVFSLPVHPLNLHWKNRRTMIPLVSIQTAIFPKKIFNTFTQCH